MYKYMPEHKKASKELIRHLYDKYYMNPIKVAIEEKQAQDETTRKSVREAGTGRRTVTSEHLAAALSYTDVKGFILGQNWKSSSTSQLALAYHQKAPDAPIQKIKQCVQRITWELKKKELQDPSTIKKDQ